MRAAQEPTKEPTYLLVRRIEIQEKAGKKERYSCKYFPHPGDGWGELPVEEEGGT